MPTVFLNGRLVERPDATVSAFDAGLQHGVGLFETFVGWSTPDGPRIPRLDDHLDRIQSSAAALGLSNELRTGPLADAVRETLAASGMDRSRVRLTITGGDLNMLQTTGRSGHAPSVLIDCQPATEYPKEMFERGVGVVLGEARANPLDPTAGHKTLNYWWRLRELQRAASAGAGEALVFQVTNHVCGGAVSNLFVLKDGSLSTPIARGEEGEGTPADARTGAALPSPVLPGITRGAVIEAASAMGVGCARRMLAIDDLLDADEVFLTNSSWGVLPVTRIEAESIGEVGELSAALRERVSGV